MASAPTVRTARITTSTRVGIAAGMFITAIHLMGLVTLPHTPNPMAFLRTLLSRGTNEKAVLVLPVGYPAADARVPDLQRLRSEEFIQWNAEQSRSPS